MSKEKRKEIIQEIQNKRKSIVITYITSDRPNLSTGIKSDIVPIIHDHLLALKPERKTNIDLIIYSRGGDSDIPWSIVSMLREYCPEGSFNVLIPFRAHSAATMIALGADEIVMTKKAEIGPIDITIAEGPYNPTEKDDHQRLPVTVEDVMGYFSLLEKIGCGTNDEKMKAFDHLTSQVHPLVLGTVSRLLDQTKLVAKRLLNTRTNSFSEEDNDQIVKRLSSEIYSHRHSISRTEAITHLGLKQVVKAEEIGIENELWQLYEEYKQYFCLEDPFRPEDYLIINKLDEFEWKDLKLVCVESENQITFSQRDIIYRKIRKFPPSITINLNNLEFPVINLPKLPENVTIDQINQLIQQLLPTLITPIINNAVDVSANNYLRALPTAGYEREEYNIKWIKEV
jgi:hypothetical protein